MIFHIKNFLIRVRMQKLCPFYKFQRDFVNKVEIHICKFSQQLDHISHGKLIFFYFFDISIIFFFFKLKRRSTGGVHLVEWAKLLMKHRGGGAPLLTLPKNSTECTPTVDRLFSFRKNKRKWWKCQKIKENKFPLWYVV